MDLSPAIFSVVCLLVVLQRPSRDRAPRRDDRSPFLARLPYRQRSVEHAGIRARLQLQVRTKDGKSQRVPRLVIGGVVMLMGDLSCFAVEASLPEAHPRGRDD